MARRQCGWRAHSAFTQWWSVMEVAIVSIHAGFRQVASGQLPFLGLSRRGSLPDGFDPGREMEPIVLQRGQFGLDGFQPASGLGDVGGGQRRGQARFQRGALHAKRLHACLGFLQGALEWPGLFGLLLTALGIQAALFGRISWRFRAICAACPRGISAVSY